MIDKVVINNKKILEKEDFGLILFRYYRENKVISVNYRKNKLIKNISASIEQVDLISKVLYLSNSIKINFKDIINIKK